MEKLQSLQLSDLKGLTNVPPQYLKPLAAIGGLWASYQLLKLTRFTWYHFLRPYNLKKYKGGKGEPWALVTGASDGIGYGFAEELCQQGFNIILHGRNEKKLQGVRDTLQSQWPARKFKILVLDAVKDSGDSAKLAAAVAEFKSINLKVLINNVGGGLGKPNFESFIDQTPKAADGWIDLNLRFPTQFTKQLLPQLITNQPTLIVNIGSAACEVPSPWLSVYSGAKAYNKSWSRSLAVELLDAGHDIDCHAIVVGAVATNRMPRSVDYQTPTTRNMAKSALGYAGSGIADVPAYWGHDFMLWTFSLLPHSYAVNFVRQFSKELKDKEMKDLEEEAKRQ
ncbi:hypothetical protein Q7P37_002041 [Cladosporium fusiforme]